MKVSPAADHQVIQDLDIQHFPAWTIARVIATSSGLG
jgi:hypothetical protein